MKNSTWRRHPDDNDADGDGGDDSVCVITSVYHH